MTIGGRELQARTITILVVVVCVMFLGTLGVAITAVLQNRSQGQDIQGFKDAAKASCERTRIFGPSLADAYDKYAILTDSQVAVYRSSIPSSCP